MPDVVLAEADLLVTTAVDQTARTAAHDEALGRSLALFAPGAPTRSGAAARRGSGPATSTRRRATDGARFYGSPAPRPVRPLRARACGRRRWPHRLEMLLPPGGPALVHGDLWWGNVLFGARRRARGSSTRRSTVGIPRRTWRCSASSARCRTALLHAYAEVQPLHAAGRSGSALFQLTPLLVHAVLFGGGYRAEAEAVARRFA